MDNATRPSHTRGEQCEKCVYDAWQNASLHMMVMDFTKPSVAKKQETEMQRKGSVRKAFGTLRESFRSQTRKEEVEASNHPKLTKRQNASGRRLWRN